MSVATIFNPLSEPVNPAKRRLWIFYVSSRQNLGLGDGGNKDFWAEREESLAGPIAAGSSLAVIQYRQWACVPVPFERKHHG